MEDEVMKEKKPDTSEEKKIDSSSILSLDSTRFVEKNELVGIFTKISKKDLDINFAWTKKGHKLKVRRKKFLSMEALVGLEYEKWYELKKMKPVPLDSDPFKEEIKNEENQEKQKKRFDKMNEEVYIGFKKKKHKKEKKMKTVFCFVIKKPTTRLICESYLRKSGWKRDIIRADALAYLLYKGNIQPNCTAVVFDTVKGAIVSSIYERMGGKYGRIYRVYPGNLNSNLHILNNLPEYVNYKKELKEKSNLVNFDFKKEILVHIPVKYFYEEYKEEYRKEEFKSSEIKFNEEYYDIVKNKKVDTLVIATEDYDHTEIFWKLYPMLKLSGSIAIYSRYREPLEKLFRAIRLDNSTVNLKINDIFTREYQVLPERTHPLMTTKNESGYILSGIKVEKD